MRQTQDLCATNLRQLPEDINKLTALTILRLAGNHLTELGRLDGIVSVSTPP